MQPMTISEIVRATGGVRLDSGADRTVADVCTDSRTLTPDCLFVPWVGERFDGHDFIEAALDAGAAAALCAKVPDHLRSDKVYIQVPDTRLALKALASAYRNRFQIPFIQITGSVGKTTLKEMLTVVLSARYRVLQTPGNYNNDIGTPLTLFRLSEEYEVAVIETGMNHFGEIRYLGEMIRPDVAVITNIGDAHIEFLGGTREGVLQAKSEIFDNLKPNGLAVLNGDDPMLDTLQPEFPTVRCGKGKRCDVRVTAMEDHGLDGVSCRVETSKDAYDLNIRTPGEHMIYPASIAVAVAEHLGLSREEIVRGMGNFHGVEGRMRVLRLSQNRIILDDCYNANPQSVAAGLEVLAKSDGAKKLAILGDMGELGALTPEAHYNIGALAVMLGIDQVIAIGERAEKLSEGVRDNGGNVLYFRDKAAAWNALRRAFTPGTVALVKASHFFMHFEEVVHFLMQI